MNSFIVEQSLAQKHGQFRANALHNSTLKGIIRHITR